MLTTWPIQSVINEAPFLCAREGKKGILTNCVDTRLVGWSRCCKSLVSRRLVQSSLANLFVSHEVCLWNFSIQEDSVCSCNPLDDEEATASPSEEDEAMREWRQEFPEQLRRVIVRIHTNHGHPQNSALAKMISDAGGSEEMIKCATRYPCSVCKRMSQPRLRRPVSVPRTRLFNDTLLADVHFWNYQGREVLVYSMIDEATRFHVTQILLSPSARALYEAIMTAWVKWAGAPRFLLVDPHRSHQARQFIEQLEAQGTTVLVGAAEANKQGNKQRNKQEKQKKNWKTFENMGNILETLKTFSKTCKTSNYMENISKHIRTLQTHIKHGKTCEKHGKTWEPQKNKKNKKHMKKTRIRTRIRTRILVFLPCVSPLCFSLFFLLFVIVFISFSGALGLPGGLAAPNTTQV